MTRGVKGADECKNLARPTIIVKSVNEWREGCLATFDLGFEVESTRATRRRSIFLHLPSPAAASRFRAQESDSSRACMLSGERCGRLSSIYMYFPLFPVIILREEKLSRDLSADASSGDALSNLRNREPDDLLEVGYLLFDNMLLSKKNHVKLTF